MKSNGWNSSISMVSTSGCRDRSEVGSEFGGSHSITIDRGGAAACPEDPLEGKGPKRARCRRQVPEMNDCRSQMPESMREVIMATSQLTSMSCQSTTRS